MCDLKIIPGDMAACARIIFGAINFMRALRCTRIYSFPLEKVNRVIGLINSYKNTNRAQQHIKAASVRRS